MNKHRHGFTLMHSPSLTSLSSLSLPLSLHLCCILVTCFSLQFLWHIFRPCCRLLHRFLCCLHHQLLRCLLRAPFVAFFAAFFATVVALLLSCLLRLFLRLPLLFLPCLHCGISVVTFSSSTFRSLPLLFCCLLLLAAFHSSAASPSPAFSFTAFSLTAFCYFTISASQSSLAAKGTKMKKEIRRKVAVES
jgi:hypothetical protein